MVHLTISHQLIQVLADTKQLTSYYMKQWWLRDWFNKKMSSYQYSISHSGDETILWLSYLHNGFSMLVRYIYIELEPLIIGKHMHHASTSRWWNPSLKKATHPNVKRKHYPLRETIRHKNDVLPVTKSKLKKFIPQTSDICKGNP